MELPELIGYVKSGGGICAPLLLLALLWMNNERKNALAKLDTANAKLESLSERSIILFTEIKGLLGNR